MDDIYCVGLCPLCREYGMLQVRKIDGELVVQCDECYLKFKNPKDAKKHRRAYWILKDSEDVSLEEVIEHGWAEYVYILRDGKWINFVDSTKTLAEYFD